MGTTLGQESNASLVHDLVTLAALVSLVEQPLQQLLTILTRCWLVKTGHLRIVSGGGSLGRNFILIGFVDGCHPLVLFVLSSRQDGEGVDVVFVNQLEIERPPRVS